MLNIIFTGNLTSDPNVRTVQGDKTVCSFTVAVNKRTKSGEEAPIFINVTTWDKRAETCAKYLAKGRKVCVTADLNNYGDIRAHAYTKKDGNANATLEVTASSVEFLSPKGSGADQSGFTPVEDESLPF